MAQRVRGTLTDSTTQEPVPGAVLSVSDSTGRFLSRGVADGSGHFDLPRLPGSARLRVVRIGYSPLDATLPAGDEPLNLHMLAIASRLATVTTAGRRVCPGDSGNSQALELWEQVRAGFFASVVARESKPPTLLLRYYRVERDPMLRRVQDDSNWSRTVVGDESFIAARSAAVFASDGFMHEHSGGERDFFAPDENVLLDPAFAGSHCLRVVAADPAHRNEIGIAFDPIDAERDTVVDIRGTVWLDRKDLNLRTLDFDYTNLERVKSGAGGNITFQLMPSGVPMIVKWMIHSPEIATDVELTASGVRRAPLPRPARTSYRVLGYIETGAHVRQVAWADGTRWAPRLPAVTGFVVDSHGRRIAGARVWMYGIQDTALTDTLGEFRMARPVPGIYALVASDSTLAAAGINESVPKRVVVGEERYATTDVNVDVVQIHPRAEALKAACPDGRYAPGQGVAIVRVVTDSGFPARGAHIDVESLQNIVVGDTIARPVHRAGEVGPDGRFIVCGAALDQPMGFRASLGDALGDAGIARWSDDVMVVTIPIRRRP